ncbi:hypothetical protein CONPUDRAFT_70281 [Coniophora puteana RWD-64-598 SS2]|uniref:Uncharacterized protein n=1 Tax=Coniophora puteana (strain RWD-64-598) TaxID=741705 RepID=A0A5M3N3R4_CONPW|nr:uncharacterized protein CONPUDRAFT_70281 [Coniophora puteana RWD-64-598 SS2]EIW85485.1 hypothetical protein CONPUDRAFT_70281 [Coniophora puteana RWD-64-598 SS2]
MAVVGVVVVLLVAVCVALVIRSYRRRRKRSSVAKVEDNESLTRTTSTEEEAQDYSQCLQETINDTDGGARNAPSGTALAIRPQSQPNETVERRVEQLEGDSGSSDQHILHPAHCTRLSAPEGRHNNGIDSVSFHTTRTSSFRSDPLLIHPPPLIPPSSSDDTTTASPRLSLAPILTEFRTGLGEMGASHRMSDANSFQREVRHRESRMGLSTAHSQSSIFSFPPPSYSSARLPSYYSPDEEIPALSDQYQGDGGSRHHGVNDISPPQ